jgi:peroxiredoxin
MKPMYWIFFIIIAVTASTTGGYVSYNYFSQPATGATQLPAFSLPDVDGQPRHASEWQGKIVIINFWATWCPPCVKEMPLFVRLQEKYGVQGIQFIGVGIDRLEAIKAFIKRIGVNYPILVGEQEAVALSESLGNKQGGLPFTVIIDRSGHIAKYQLGEVSEKYLEAAIAELLAQPTS